MAQRSPALARPAAISSDVGLRLRRLLSLPEAPFAALAAPCGDGQFLAGLTAGSAAIRYGIEPHRPAANQAATHLSRVLVCDLEDARVSHDEVSLLVLCPAARRRTATAASPSGDVGAAARLRVLLPWLRPGGILLALLVPQELTPSTIKLLSARCDAVSAYRLSSSVAGALVVLGLKKANPGFDPAMRDALATPAPAERRCCPCGPLPATRCPRGAACRSSGP